MHRCPYRPYGPYRPFCFVALALASILAAADEAPIKAFCVDFNWGPGGENGFAPPGLWADASPEEHVAWYAGLGVNTIQTFAVSCNGYAWYKNGLVPEQPGLERDFLTEVVRLGHARGMRVMAYFCVGSNTRWAKENPDFSYGAPSQPHLFYSDRYLDFLAASIRDAVEKTGIDGFMIDWVWNPDKARADQNGGAWKPAEKELYAQLMGEPFPGEAQLSDAQKTAYDRASITQCWKRIRDAAPDSVIWLSCNDLNHPSVVDSPLLREVDWIMNEHPDPERLAKVIAAATDRQRVIQCIVGWGDQHNAYAVVTNKEFPTRDFYGFARPGDNSLPLPIQEYLDKPIESFSGNDKNIATLARFYNGLLDASPVAPAPPE
ncbi:MAG TPA: hypothetical protein PLO37_18355 [Candidatus Hydrogenedentes bacterium]|nr:hypothetical protein [Candidatus Hydrogenedentota bacterium]HPG68814.1 hypothetical protein [Candidatus Hydrogenedentota bacterium]